MATWGETKTTSTGGNVKMQITAGYGSVSRSGNRVTAQVYGKMAPTGSWSSNEYAIWVPSGGTKKQLKRSGVAGSGSWEGYVDYSFDVGAADTSRSVTVGFGWNGWTATEGNQASVTIPFSSGMISYNMNILNPDGTEPYQTGEAGSVEESINGGGYNRVINEGSNSYGYGTTIAYRNFTPGAHRHLASVSGISPNNTTGPWSLTLTGGTTVEFRTAWNTYYRDINAWKPGNTEQGGLIFDYYIYNRDGTLVNSYTNVTNEVADTVTREYGYTGKINNIRTNVTGAHYSSNNITNTNAGEFTWTFDTTTAVELYSAWNTYTVTYNGNGATGGSTANSSHTYNTAKTLTANGYTRVGYSFAGWNTAANGSGTSYSNQQSVSNLTATNGGTVTLYAQWTPLTYTMVFDGNGATSGSMSNLTITEGEGKTITANTFSRTGYTFTGWNSKADGTGIPMANQQVITGVNETNPNPSFTSGRKTVVSGNMTYSATGSPVEPSSEFVSYGHPASRDVYVCNLTAGHTYIVGGYGIADSSAKSSSTIGVHHYTTSSSWRASTYIEPTQRTWRRVGGVFTIPSDSTTQHLWIQINGDGTSATALAGWYWTGVNCRDMSLPTTQTVYAQWKLNSYTVAYNANGGTSTPATQTANYNSSITLAPAIAKNNTDSNVTITVTYNANGGSGAPGNSTGTAVNTTPYTFNKWALNSTSGTQYAAGASYTIPASNSTMYATWTTGITTRKSNPSITLSSTKPTRSGYNFKGWSTSSTATTASYNAGTAYTFSSNTTLYAVWELAQAQLYTKTAIPSAYQAVEYIESTGTQYIDTGAQVFSGTNHKIELDFSPTSFYDYNTLWGCTTDANLWEAWIYSTGQLASRYNNVRYGADNAITVNTRYKYVVQKEGTTLSKVLNGTIIGTGTSADKTTTGSLLLFLSGTDYGRYKIYGCRLWDNGGIIRDLRPCYRKSDNVIGLYDTINGTFYTNSGTGTFSKGSNVNGHWSYGPAYVKVGGAWKIAKQVYTKVNGAWVLNK